MEGRWLRWGIMTKRVQMDGWLNERMELHALGSGENATLAGTSHLSLMRRLMEVKFQQESHS